MTSQLDSPLKETKATVGQRVRRRVRRRLGTALGLAAALLVVVHAPASAHVRWFTGDELHPIQTDLIFSLNTLLLILVAGAALGILYLLQRFVGDRYWPHIQFLDKMAIGAPTLLAVQAAVTLIHAAVQPTLFVPNLELEVTFVGLTLATIQILIALSFITGVGDWLAAVVLILLGPVALLMFPVMQVLEQLLWAGIGIFVLLTGRFSVYPEHARPWFNRFDPAWGHRAITWMRVVTGVSFIALGLGEKLWNPDLGREFIDQDPRRNFLQETLGLEWFTDDVFVLAAGLTEATIGILLISGVLTRVVIAGMWLPFNLGLPFLPPEELLGHLPIFGIMYVLLVYYPRRKPLVEPREEPPEDPADIPRT